eukprot:562886_1
MSKRRSFFDKPQAKKRKIDKATIPSNEKPTEKEIEKPKEKEIEEFNPEKAKSKLLSVIQTLSSSKQQNRNTTKEYYHFYDGTAEFMGYPDFLHIFIPELQPDANMYSNNKDNDESKSESVSIHISSRQNDAKNNNIWQSLLNSNVIHQSKVGIGAETVLNKDIRSSHELDAYQFSLSGKQFEIHDSRTNDILENVRKKLAPNVPYIHAMKYKMIIYQTGDFFNEHKDTFRGSGHIGTLLLFLPTQFEGGEFVLKYDEKLQHQFKVNQNTRNIEYVAFYGDIIHQVLPVTSGYRICIAFNLYLPPNSNSLRINPSKRKWYESKDDFNVEVYEAIKYALSERDNPDKYGDYYQQIVIALDHEYAGNELHSRNFKGRDLLLYAAICHCEHYMFTSRKSNPAELTQAMITVIIWMSRRKVFEYGVMMSIQNGF